MGKAKVKPAKPRPAAPAPAEVQAPAPVPMPAGLAAAPPRYVAGSLMLRDLRPSPTNPRKTFDEGKLAQLAQSIRQVGVAQPLVVRPLGESPRWTPTGLWQGVDGWEIVAGERRFRAAGIAGLAEVPVRAALLTDEQVADIQFVENDQREDLPVSERAAAYAERARTRTAEQISAQVGKPLSEVRDLIRLARLPAWMLAAVDAGDVSPSVAALVARIPDAENRRRASACVLLGDDYPDRLDDKDFKLCESGKARSTERNDYIEPVLTYRDTKDLLREFQRELKGAPFRKALDLVPGVPTCEDCPKRAGNAAKADDSFADVRADTCLDTACFAAKTAAWGRQVAAKAEKKGRTVVMGDEAAKLFHPHGGLRHGCGYIDPAQTCWEDNQPGPDRTYGVLLKGHVEPVVVVGPDGRAHDLYPADAARAALKEHHKIGVRPAKGGDSYKRQEAEQRRKQEIGRAAAAKALGHVAERMEATDQSHAADARLREVNLLRQVARAVVDHAGADACRMVAKRRGLKYDPVNTRQVVEDLALEMTEVHELLGLMAESCAARMANYWGHPYGGGNVSKEEAAFWSAFGVDKAALVKAAGEEQKAAKQVKQKPAKAKPAPAAARTTAKPTGARSCRVCGCTDDDCRQCIKKTGEPCTWVEPDLCSACVPTAGDLKLSALDRKGVTTLGKLVELADDGETDDPRTALFAFLQRLPGVGKGPAATAADVVADHLRPSAKPIAPVQLGALDSLPDAVLDLLDAAGCLSVEQVWSAAQEAADAELLARPRREVLLSFLKDLGAKPVAADRAAGVIAAAMPGEPAGKAVPA